VISQQFVRFEVSERIGTITLDRPDRLNAWHAPMRRELVDVLRTVNADERIGAAILTGTGERAFSAGQDLAESEQFDAARAQVWIDEFEELYETIRSLEKPLVAALNGVAAGSGFQVALLCDVRVAHPEVEMGQTEVNSGIPSVTGPWIMAERMGLSRTVEMALTGRLMLADEARQAGLVHYVVPREEVMPKARELARHLASQPPVAMRLTKRRFREVTEPAFRAAFAAARIIDFEAYGSGEPQAMMARFFEVRAERRGGPAEGA
jgi:enoyl-CoA hydratase/carnithine racemase